jgi:2-methylcitrate dehydratase PrpD
MSDDEQLINTLANAWHQAIQMRGRSTPEQRQWWEGFIAATAMAIAAASGLPPGGTTLTNAIRYGCEIARARP